jgi:hypothetical protein
MPKSNFASGREVGTVRYSTYHTMSSIVLFHPLLETVSFEKTSTLLQVATATVQLQKNTTFGEKTDTTNAIRARHVRSWFPKQDQTVGRVFMVLFDKNL